MANFTGGDGDDDWTGGKNGDLAHGGKGDDVLQGVGGADSLFGDAGNDWLDGGDGDDTLNGGVGDDSLMAGAGANLLIGGAGNDYLGGDLGSNTLRGGAGNDVLHAGGTWFSSLNGGAGDDTLDSGGWRGVLIGGGGDDTIYGYGKKQHIDGGDGSDNLKTAFASKATVDGGGGDDIITLHDPDGPVTARGGDGHDLFILDLPGSLKADFSGLAGGGEITLRGQITLGGFEGGTVELSAGHNVIRTGDLAIDVYGGDSIARIVGGAADNHFYGGSSNDTLIGGGGDDTLSGGGGDNILNGGDGVDTVSFSFSQSVTVDLSIKGPQQTGAGLDTLIGIENLIGSSYGDALTGDNHDNVIQDTDLSAGGDGASTLNGSGGDDTLIAHDGAETDVLAGGRGADLFVFLPYDISGNVPDEITDLEKRDTIDLSNIDADRTIDGDQAFVLVKHLDGHAGEAALVYDAGSNQTSLLLDTNGDGAADVTVILDGHHKGFDHFVL